MRYWFGKMIMRLGGWKIVDDIPKDLRKAVLVAAPHTSNWDFVYGLAGLWVLKRRMRYLIKKELWFFPFNLFLSWSGGIPVDRSKPNHLTDHLTELLEKSDELLLLFPPEGTRSWVPKWKTGFYRVALNTNLPIILGFMDFRSRSAGFGDWFDPSGDLKADFRKMEDFYSEMDGKYPEKFNRQFYIREE